MLWRPQISPAGDHTLFIGVVRAILRGGDVPPLLFHGGRFRRLAEAV